jgi:hypothetical protein
MQDELVELNLPFPLKAGFNKKKAFRQQVRFKFKEETNKILIWKIAYMVRKLGRYGILNRNTCRILNCGAGEGWKRSIGPNM